MRIGYRRVRRHRLLCPLLMPQLGAEFPGILHHAVLAMALVRRTKIVYQISLSDLLMNKLPLGSKLPSQTNLRVLTMVSRVSRLPNGLWSQTKTEALTLANIFHLPDFAPSVFMYLWT